MSGLLEIALSNAVVATMLALLAAGIARMYRRPALTHSLWLLVLLKLVTPPIIPVQTSWIIPVELTEKDKPPEMDVTGGYGGNSPDRTLLMSGNQIADQASFATLPPVSPRSVQGSGNAGEVSDTLLREGESEKWRSGEWESAVTVSPPPRFAVSQFLWPRLLVPLWAAGSLLVFGWTIWHTYRFHRLLRFARPAPCEAQKEVQELARRLGLKRCPILYLLPAAVSPMIWTIGCAPRLLFPARLLDRLDRDQRAALFVHELAHLARRDHWVRILELIVLGLYWWHPVVWWARRELHEAEEQCCDAWVIWALCGQNRAYALALLHTVDFFSHARPTLPVAASGIGQVPHLRRRLTMIMQEKTPRSLTWAGCVAVLALGLLLPLAPILGQEAPKKAKNSQSDKDGRDQQIEALKRAIQILEEQKRVEKQVGDLKKADEELSNAAKAAEVTKKLKEVKEGQVLVNALTKEVEANRKALKASEAKLEAAKQRLDKLTGKGKQSNRIEFQFVDPSERDVRFLDTLILQNNVDPLIIPQENLIYPPTNTLHRPAGQDKKGELEQKVDKLLKEVEELKRELQKQKQGGSQRK